MMVTDATLPGNPIVFANNAFVELSGYSMEELIGQDPHFLNGPGTDPAAIRRRNGCGASHRLPGGSGKALNRHGPAPKGLAVTPILEPPEGRSACRSRGPGLRPALPRRRSGPRAHVV